MSKKSSNNKKQSVDLSAMTPEQIDKYVTEVTGIGVKRGSAKDRKAGRSRGRYGKDHL